MTGMPTVSQTTDRVFLSYSRNDSEAAVNLRAQFKVAGLAIFRDEDDIRQGELWLERLQSTLDGCSGFVVLVGRDGVRRWIGAETQVALSRYFGPHEDSKRLPIYPILLGDVQPATLPAFLRLFQVTRWNGADPLPQQLFDEIRARTISENKALLVEGCPFVGLDAYGMNQAHLFFGRQQETLDALACFGRRTGSPTVRWLEINGNSGSGKSSLMNAGMLPLVKQGWLWARTGFEHWQLIGPMMPGEHPVAMLAENLSRAFSVEMAAVRKCLEENERGLADWLRGRKQEDTAFLLAIDQFEELFTFADPDERARFDRLLATALADADCPLFVLSTVRADFLDRFDDLPRLVALRNRMGQAWTLPSINAAGLREVIAGPARLAGLDVTAVQEAMVAEARDEPGALPLVENALYWLWEKREGNRLSGQLFNDQGGLAGILSHSADDLLKSLGKQREQALELLFRLVKVDPEGRRHTRRRMPLAEAVALAGGREPGRDLVNRLAGERSRDDGEARGPLRLITVTDETSTDKTRWVSLIHETLIRGRGGASDGRPQPYWLTLWNYIDENKERAALYEHLQLLAREWKERRTRLSRAFGLAGPTEIYKFRGLAVPESIEERYLRWSTARASVAAIAVLAVIGLLGETWYWAAAHELPLEAVTTRWAYKFGKPLSLPKLVQIPAGHFEMGELGDSYTKPVHRVTFAEPFWIGATEVTFAQYDPYCKSTARACPDDRGWGRGEQPVIYVDWYDARAYANWLSAMTGKACRLPSEAEWEYAARAGTTTRYPWGDEPGSGKANFRDLRSERSGQQAAPVRSFPPNSWGLYDTSGNVWEWVQDGWHDSYEGAPSDGSPWETEDQRARMVRGGSWYLNANLARSAARSGNDPVNRGDSFGFRVLCSSPIE